MTTRAERARADFLRRARQVRGQLAKLSQNDYLNLLFDTNSGRLIPAIGFTVAWAATIAVFVFLTTDPTIVLTINAVSVILCLLVPWKRHVDRFLSPKENK